MNKVRKLLIGFSIAAVLLGSFLAYSVYSPWTSPEITRVDINSKKRVHQHLKNLSGVESFEAKSYSKSIAVKMWLQDDRYIHFAGLRAKDFDFNSCILIKQIGTLSPMCNSTGLGLPRSAACLASFEKEKGATELSTNVEEVLENYDQILDLFARWPKPSDNPVVIKRDTLIRPVTFLEEYNLQDFPVECWVKNDLIPKRK